MNRDLNTPGPKDRNKNNSNVFSKPGATSGKETGDNNLAESSPTDSRSDEKVIVNEQRENKIVNSPSQTAVNSSEGSSNDEEIIN